MDVPAFRWVEKETGRVMTCSSPADCAEIERRLADGGGLLAGDGASRGNLFSGEADAVILTASRMSAEKRANQGYRAFLANGFNVTQVLVLFTWEVIQQRNGYDLYALVERSMGAVSVARTATGDENEAAVTHAVAEATGRSQEAAPQRLGAEQAVVLASGNLGLIHLMDAPSRLTLEQIPDRHPVLLPALYEHPHIGFVLVHSGEHGPVALGGARYLRQDRAEGEDPLAQFSHNTAAHLLRSDSFAHAPDILVNSFYDPALEQGCGFEELISFHGGLGGPRPDRSSCTRWTCLCRRSRSSVPKPSTSCSQAGGVPVRASRRHHRIR